MVSCEYPMYVAKQKQGHTLVPRYVNTTIYYEKNINICLRIYVYYTIVIKLFIIHPPITR